MTQSLTDRVAAEVRAEMARQRVSHKQVAEWLGISQPQISRRLRCEIPFRTTELETIAERLAVPVTQFFPSTAPVSAA